GPGDLRIRVDEDIELRLQSVDDAGEYFALIDGDRERLRTFMEWVDGLVRIEDEQAFLSAREEEHVLGRGLSFGIWHLGRIVGAVGTVTLDRLNEVAEVGYFVVGEHEGRGLMFRAVGAFCDHLFAEEGMNRLSARIMTSNHRSRALIERLGFTLEGVHRQEYKLRGEHHDMAVYSLLRSEWDARRGRRA
ncbi:MAG: GNAT family N-acetyltransferase, partial [Thermoplasmata archaeon]|nr:GNAT family N-acetyltransferase [Thermoplasmata archaeon]NIS12452.1 GNAT family N-acetyltransferase [Thermoplasmata archaeon]NIS20373.1 GNAT family N-acetyltransferase [Thermoplasmata archaeon]NIT77719.1 GNAT family N-acetyltransferase [Thermoplasmata archaeon]NIU49460.1 GNAT family N-acetyltransferase [Thermoplasmata archaeon]